MMNFLHIEFSKMIKSSAFLQLNQLISHTLIIPLKTEIDHWMDVQDEEYFEVYKQARVIAAPSKKQLTHQGLLKLLSD